jgi:large subunit ribosomal protein L15
MKANQLKSRTDKKVKRLGRGYGSGVGGHVVGRGQKGQKSRSGHKSMVFFEGGNLPFFRRIPKFKGFKSLNKVVVQGVNLTVISKFFNDGDEVTVDSLKKKGIVRKNAKAVKILGFGNLTKKVVFKGLVFSKSAEASALKSGAKIEK